MNLPRKIPSSFLLPSSTTTLSNVFGHLSFLLLGTSYLTTDILTLRTVAMSGMTAGVIFQYYRAAPLFIPIRWNLLFILMNSVMVLKLLQERNEAEKTPADLLKLYEEEFAKMGFTKIEFYRLAVLNARKVEMERGQPLAVAGEIQSRMYFLVDGTVDVLASGTSVAAISKSSFIGEMTFLLYLQEAVESKARATCLVSSDTAVVLEWDFGALEQYLQTDRGLRNALQAYISNDLRKKLMTMTAEREEEISHRAPNLEKGGT